VRVERDRVRALDPAEALAAAVGELEEAAVRRVDGCSSNEPTLV